MPGPCGHHKTLTGAAIVIKDRGYTLTNVSFTEVFVPKVSSILNLNLLPTLLIFHVIPLRFWGPCGPRIYFSVSLFCIFLLGLTVDSILQISTITDNSFDEFQSS